MWHNLQRFTLGAILLASLSLFLFGCGTGSAPTAPVTKTISGTVSDPTTGLPISNATVAAYAVDASGTVSAKPISLPATTLSDGWGHYSLNIPVSYAGAVLVQATVGSAKAVTPQKQVAAAASGTVIRSLLFFISGDTSDRSNVMLNLATEMLYQYILINKGGVVNVDNIREATLMLEPFFGPNFSQIEPSSFDTVPTAAQQNLMVRIQAVTALLSPPYNYTIANLVTVTPPGGNIGLGGTTILAQLKTEIATASADLIDSGMISGSYQSPTITPLTQTTVIGSLPDITPPAAPTGLTAVATYNTVTLTWNSVSGATAYNVYRDGVFTALVTAPTVTYTDTTVTDSTAYTYMVQARDLAGNLSAGTTVAVTTKAIPTFTISGKVTLNGTALANVSLTLAGAGNGATKTDASGNYSFTGVRIGSYSITPSITGYLFAPAFRLVSISTADATAQDFAAVLSGSVNGGTTFPDGSVTTTTTFPDGTVVTTTTFPNGTVVVTTNFPNGTVTTKTTYPDGTVTTTTTYPNGTVTTATTYPDGTATVITTYPNGTVSTTTTYPNGTVTVGTTYPDGTATVVTTYPNGTVATAITNADGSVTTTTAYPNGVVTTTTTYSSGTVGGGVVYPNGTLSSTLGYYAIVYGTAYDIDATTPLNGIELVFTDSAGSAQTKVTTSSFGTYYFSGLPGHTYTLTSPTSGYAFTPGSFTVSATDPNGAFDANGNFNIKFKRL
jgi:inhibitor of cysteine peptidase